MTDAGQELIANALAGSGTVAFTSVKTSSYAYPNGTNISGLTDIQDIVQSVDPFSAQVFNETMLQVSARFDNSQVQDEYLIQTLGLYAQVESGSPVLFAVIQADTPDQMPAQSAVSPSAFIYNIQMTVQQATSLKVSVNPAGTATVQDILNLEAAKVNKNGGDLVDTVATFDDSGSVSGITSFPEFLATFLSNTKTGIFLRNLKAGLQYVLHVGSIVNDCVTNNPSLPLSAAQGKVLMDGKAPNNHASGAAIYGLGNASQYGHVKLSDAYTASAGNAAAGMGASSYALAQAYSVLNTKLSFENGQKLAVGYGNDGNFYLVLYTSSGERRQITLTADRFYYGYNDVFGQWHDIWHLSSDIEIEMGSYLGNGQGTQSFNSVKLSKVENGFITQGPGSIARGINGSLGSQWDCGADSNENGLTYYYVLFGSPR